MVNENSGLVYCTIQSAIDAAQTVNGHTIRVVAGTFNENITVNKSLTLRGANTGTALTACGETRLAETVINGSTGAAITIASNGVTVDGFELQGAIGYTNIGFTDLVVTNNKVNTVARGIIMAGATTSATNEVTITGNAVTLSTQAISTTPTAGIVLASVGGDAAATVSNNILCGGFYGYALSNVTTTPRTVISGGSITGVMQGVAAFNTTLELPYTPLPMTVGVDGITMSGFTGAVPAIPDFDFHAGISAITSGSNAGAVLDMTVNNVDISGTGKHSWDNAGMYFADYSTGVASTLLNVSVTNSHIHDNLNLGVHVRGSNTAATVAGSDILYNGADPNGNAGRNGHGLIVFAGAQLTVNNCNVVNPATQVGFSVNAIGSGPSSVDFTLFESNIDRNGNGLHMAIGGGGTLTATCNWWGTANIDALDALIPLAPVTFLPYLNDGTDNSADRGFQTTAACVNPTKWYVNDNATTGDVYTQAVGNDANAGTVRRPKLTMNAAITVAAAGDTLYVDAGTFAENTTVSKRLLVQGAGSTGETHVNGSITISASGTNATERLVVKDLSVTNAAGQGFTYNAGIKHITLDNVAAINSSTRGVEIVGSSTLLTEDLVFNNCRINNNGGHGIRMGGLANVAGLTIMGGEISSNGVIGFSYSPSSSAIGLTNLLMDGTVLEKNGVGMYATGTNTGSGDISLFGFNGVATLNNVTVIGGDNAGDATGAVAVQLRGINTAAPAGTITVNGLSITGHYKRIVSNAVNPLAYGLYIANYSNVSPISLNNVVVDLGTGHALGVAGLTNTLEMGNSSLNAQAAGYAHIINGTSAQNNVLSNVNATGTTLGGVAAASATLAQQFAIEDKVFHAIDAAGLGFVRVKADEVFVTPISFVPSFNTPSIQRGVDAAAAGNTVHVQAGSFAETVTVNKALDIRGANYGVDPNTGSRVAESILSGTFSLQSSGISVNGFEVTGSGAAFAGGGAGPWSNVSLTNNRMIGKTGQQTVAYGFSLGNVTTSIGATNWTVSNNLIENVQANDATAIALFNITGLSVNDNVILHNNPASLRRRGLNLSGGQTVSFLRNLVDMGLVGPVWTNTAEAGIGAGAPAAWDAARYALQLDATDRSTTNVTIDANTFKGAAEGFITLANGVFADIAFTNNVMTDIVRGIRFQGGITLPDGEHTNISVTNNAISTNWVCILLPQGITSGGSGDPYQNVQITQNSLLRATAGVALEVEAAAILIGGPITATCNWYGSAVPADVQGRVLGNVSFTPWLIDGADGSANIGFQPVGACEGYPVTLTARAVLSGAYVSADGLMRGTLRLQNNFPLSQPYNTATFGNYAGTETITDNTILITDGNDGIVDWVLLELRDATTPATVLKRRAALIQRDGDIVDVDGTTPIFLWDMSRDFYHVAVRHRNHLGAMTGTSVYLGGDPSLSVVDFRTVTTFGTNAQKQLAPGVKGLWSGNLRSNNRVSYTGSNNDRDAILPLLPNSSLTSVATNQYANADLNLDGLVKYTGSANDRDPILVNIGGVSPTAVLLEQLP